MDAFEIKTDRTAEILVAKDEAVMKALEVIGIEAEKQAKIEITHAVYDKEQTDEQRKRYKRTGRLRNSISHAHDGNTVYIGTNVEYAPYVELGTKYMKERPYLKPAIENNLDRYKEIFERVLKGGN